MDLFQWHGIKEVRSNCYADDVIVSGILTAKWSPDLKDVRCNLDPVLVANHVR